MKKLWLGAFALMAAVGGVLSAQDDDPYTFVDGPLSIVAVPFYGNAVPQSITAFTSDRSANPQTIFQPRQFVAWTSEFFVVGKGVGTQTENIDIQVTTGNGRRLKTLSGTFNICNTSNPNVCDDIPDQTSWALTLSPKFPIPSFGAVFLEYFGITIPFSSVVTGTGYEDFVVNLTGNEIIF